MTSQENKAERPRVLLELRPAFDGYQGIPQETRLLFRGLRTLNSVQVVGLLQTSQQFLSKGMAVRGLFGRSPRVAESRRINRYSRVVVSASGNQQRTKFGRIFGPMIANLASSQTAMVLILRGLVGLDGINLTVFRTMFFEDFIWRTLFSKTLPASDFTLVTEADQLVCSIPWNTLHRVGLNRRRLLKSVRYPRLRTKGIEIFIGQTPYPARVAAGTALVIRYHDAIPVLMPHTISDRAIHQATHFHALASNVKSGAYFACVSEATRRDLLKIFPEVRDRAVTIHNMVSHDYYFEETSAARIPAVIRSRLRRFDNDRVLASAGFLNLETLVDHTMGAGELRYLLVVSTIEPRKNHSRVVSAWEALKAEVDSDLKLVFVGSLGWDYTEIVLSFKTWIDRGEIILLTKVPAGDLRLLYRHAAATVCPSFAEGFDFSGAESMRSGGVVIASDIPVHHEIYDGAAEFFDPYSTGSLIRAIRRTLYDADAASVQSRLRSLGQEVAARYIPEKILPQWSRFLDRVLKERCVNKTTNSGLQDEIPDLSASSQSLGLSRSSAAPRVSELPQAE